MCRDTEARNTKLFVLCTGTTRKPNKKPHKYRKVTNIEADIKANMHTILRNVYYILHVSLKSRYHYITKNSRIFQSTVL